MKLHHSVVALLLIITNLPPLLPAQSTISGRLENAQTGEPIIFAHIGIMNSGLGTISDEQGNFELITKNPLPADQLIQFSAIGFQSLRLTTEALKAGPAIQLEPAGFELPLVTVSDRQRTRRATGGHYGRSQKIVTGWSRSISRGGLRTARIKLPKRAPDAALQNLRFHLAYNDYDSILFRLHFFYADSSGKLPGELIPVPEDIYIHHGKATGDVEVDLSPWQLLVDRDFFVGIEVVRAYGNCTAAECLMFSVVLFKDRIYFRNSVTDRWDSHKLGSPAVEVEMRY